MTPKPTQAEMTDLLNASASEKPLSDALPLWQAAEVQERRKNAQKATPEAEELNAYLEAVAGVRVRMKEGAQEYDPVCARSVIAYLREQGYISHAYYDEQANCVAVIRNPKSETPERRELDEASLVGVIVTRYIVQWKTLKEAVLECLQGGREFYVSMNEYGVFTPCTLSYRSGSFIAWKGEHEGATAEAVVATIRAKSATIEAWLENQWKS